MKPEVITAVNTIIENHAIVDAIYLLLKLYDAEKESKQLLELQFTSGDVYDSKAQSFPQKT